MTSMTTTVPLLVAPAEPRTRRVQYDHERSFPDVPGALRVTADAMEADLLEDLAELYGERVAREALPHVVWARTDPSWPGGRVVLRARLTIDVQQA